MPQERRQKINDTFRTYGTQVYNLGVVDRVIVEVNSEENEVRILNVLSETPSNIESKKLLRLSSIFRYELLKLSVPVGSVSCISQEEYKDVMEECKKSGIKVWKLKEAPKTT